MSVWIGPGVFTYEGEDIEYGQDMPKGIEKKVSTA